MFPIINLGPLAIQTGGILILASVWIGTTIMERCAARDGFQSPVLTNILLIGFLSFFIGGRLFYAANHFASFLESPLDLVSTNAALFDMPGGIASALIVTLVYGFRNKLPLWSTLDAMTPFLSTMLVGLGVAHLASGTAYGKETSLPWGIELHGAVRHPSQVYELLMALLIFFLVGISKPSSKPGRKFLLFLAWTAAANLFLEAFRGDSIFIAGGVRAGQILAWVVLALALIGLERVQLTHEGN